MASKKTATKSSSSGTKRIGRTSRKTLSGKASAPYVRKAGDDDSDDKGKKSKGEAKDDTGKEAEAAKPGQPEAAVAAKAAEEAAAKAAEEAAAKAAEEAAAKAAEEAAAKAEAEKAAAEEAKAEAAAKPAPAPAESAPEFAELPPPMAIERRDPNSPAPPPGKVPPGDSRSFRRVREGVEEFVLVYRVGSFLISRSGKVGTYGEWKVVEYPYVGSASHAYAQECSVLTAAGYRDLR